MLTEEQEDAIVRGKRNGLISAAKRWPNNVVPYEIVEEHFSKYRSESTVLTVQMENLIRSSGAGSLH